MSSEYDDPPRTLSSLDFQSNGLHGLLSVSRSGPRRLGERQEWELTCCPQRGRYETIETFQSTLSDAPILGTEG